MENIRYKVYELMDGGTFHIPTHRLTYGDRVVTYSRDGYTTIEDAMKAIEIEKGRNLIIVTVAFPSWDFVD